MEKKPIRVKLRKNQSQSVYVIGDRDPRGYDNKIDVWIDENDHLHIKVLKPKLCYAFDRVVENPGQIEIVQV